LVLEGAAPSALEWEARRSVSLHGGATILSRNSADCAVEIPVARFKSGDLG